MKFGGRDSGMSSTKPWSYPSDERTAYAASACEQDAELEAAVLELLAAHDETNPLLDQQILAVAGFGDELDPEAFIGESIDGYTVLPVIGGGGMRNVYQARQREPVDRMVALKVSGNRARQDRGANPTGFSALQRRALC